MTRRRCTTCCLQHPHYPAKTTKMTRRQRRGIRCLYHIPIPWTTPNMARMRPINGTEVLYPLTLPPVLPNHVKDPKNDTEVTRTQRVASSTSPSCRRPYNDMEVTPHPPQSPLMSTMPREGGGSPTALLLHWRPPSHVVYAPDEAVEAPPPVSLSLCPPLALSTPPSVPSHYIKYNKIKCNKLN